MTQKLTTLTAVALIATAFSTAAGAQSLTNAEKQAMLENMLKADSNNDGMISRSEFEVLMQMNADDGLGAAGLVVRTGAYDKAFSKVDANGDGVLTKEEAQAMAESRG